MHLSHECTVGKHKWLALFMERTECKNLANYARGAHIITTKDLRTSPTGCLHLICSSFESS